MRYLRVRHVGDLAAVPGEVCLELALEFPGVGQVGEEDIANGGLDRRIRELFFPCVGRSVCLPG